MDPSPSQETAALVEKAPSELAHILFVVIFIAMLLAPLLEDLFQNAPISIDTFFARKPLTFAVNNFKYFALHDRAFPGVIIGPNDWLIFVGDAMDDYQNTRQYTKDDLRLTKQRLDYLCQEMTENNIKLIIVPPPNKSTIYPEYMPAEVPQLNAKSRLDQIMEVWKDTNNCMLMDLRPMLLEAKNKDQVYNSTDTHWNEMGAFLATRQITQALKLGFPAVHVPELSDYRVDMGPKTGDLALLIGQFSVYEQTFLFNPLTPPKHVFKDYNPGVLVGNSSMSYVDNPDLPTAIIYRDSFFMFLFKFISDSFRQADYYWTIEFDLDMVKMRKPDYLIIETTERHLPLILARIPLPEQGESNGN